MPTARFEFHGAFELRALPASEVKAGPAANMMQTAPLVLSGQGVEVLIENVRYVQIADLGERRPFRRAVGCDVATVQTVAPRKSSTAANQHDWRSLRKTRETANVSPADR
jgi:hypothetical protein